MVGSTYIHPSSSSPSLHMGPQYKYFSACCKRSAVAMVGSSVDKLRRQIVDTSSAPRADNSLLPLRTRANLRFISWHRDVGAAETGEPCKRVDHARRLMGVAS